MGDFSRDKLLTTIITTKLGTGYFHAVSWIPQTLTMVQLTKRFNAGIHQSNKLAEVNQ
jgi:hypothetical protein